MTRSITRTQRLLRLVASAQKRPLTAAEGLTLGRVINWTTTELDRTRTANTSARDALLDLLGIVDQWERGHSTELGRTAVCEIVSRVAHKGLGAPTEPTGTAAEPDCSSVTGSHPAGRSGIPYAVVGMPFTAQQASTITAAGLPPGTHVTAAVLNTVIDNVCGDQGENAARDGIHVICVKPRGHDCHDRPDEADDDPWHTDGRGCTWRNDGQAAAR